MSCRPILRVATFTLFALVFISNLLAQTAIADLERLSTASRSLAAKSAPAVVGIVASGYAPGDGGF